VNGRFDFQAPIASAWPRSELVIVDDAGHAGDGITRHLTAATDRFAATEILDSCGRSE